MANEGSDADAYERLNAIFGAAPYTFNDAKYMHQVAPKREFGQTKVNQAGLRTYFNRLPEYLRDMFKDKKLGFYRDVEGRVYKRETDYEDGTHDWSVYFPFALRHVGHVPMILVGETIDLFHSFKKKPSIRLTVVELGDTKIASFSIVASERSLKD